MAAGYHPCWVPFHIDAHRSFQDYGESYSKIFVFYTETRNALHERDVKETQVPLCYCNTFSPDALPFLFQER